MMEEEDKNEGGRSVMMMRPPPPAETAEFFLQWGNRKRLRCVRIRNSNTTTTTATATATSTSPPHHLSSSPSPDPVLPSSNSSARARRKITSRFPSVTSNDEKHLSFPQPTSRLTRNSETGVTLRSETRRVSPEKEERSYLTRGSGPVITNLEENGEGKVPQVGLARNQGGDEQPRHRQTNNSYKISNHHSNRGNGNLVCPKLYISLSIKEKEEDFLAMKGCKLPQRPKKRAKLIQRTILLVSPGSWLTDMSLERYEVREKKTSKKRPRGLKAMGNIDSDSE